MAVTGVPDSLVNVYTFTGLAVVIALNSFAFIFIFVKAALDMVSSEMEDAANILGAGTWRTMVTVTLPLVWPAILAGLIIVRSEEHTSEPQSLMRISYSDSFLKTPYDPSNITT